MNTGEMCTEIVRANRNRAPPRIEPGRAAFISLGRKPGESQPENLSPVGRHSGDAGESPRAPH